MNIVEVENFINRERISNPKVKGFPMTEDRRKSIKKLAKKFKCLQYNVVDSAVGILEKLQSGEIILVKKEQETQDVRTDSDN